jgi:hypothetical protein
LAEKFFAGDYPHTWSPGNSNRVAIRLTLGAMDDHDEALWQLGHEIVHVLGPVRATINLEEGLATHFALNVQYYRDSRRLAAFRAHVDRPNGPYSAPLKDCEDPDVIRKLRSSQPCFAKMTAELIREVCPNVPATLASSWSRRSPSP